MFPLLFTETTTMHHGHARGENVPDDSEAFHLVFGAFIKAEKGVGRDSQADFPQTLPMPPDDSLNGEVMPDDQIPLDAASVPEPDSIFDETADLVVMNVSTADRSVTSPLADPDAGHLRPSLASPAGTQAERLVLQKMSDQTQLFTKGPPDAQGQILGGPVVSEHLYQALPERTGTQPISLTVPPDSDQPHPSPSDQPEQDNRLKKLMPGPARAAPTASPDHAKETQDAVPMREQLPLSTKDQSAPLLLVASARGVALPATAMSDLKPDGLPLMSADDAPVTPRPQSKGMWGQVDLSKQPIPQGKASEAVVETITFPLEHIDDISEEPAHQPPGKAAPTSSMMDQPSPATILAKSAAGIVLSSDLNGKNIGQMVDRLETPFGFVPERGQAGPPTVAGSVQVTPETARYVAQQLAVVVTQQAGRSTEIALNPIELGRVRMNMSAHDGALSLHIMVERPETTDLLRRHIDTLAGEFHALGYSDVTFSFNQERSPEPEPDDIAPIHENSDEPQATAASPVPIGHNRSSSGLDLRL